MQFWKRSRKCGLFCENLNFSSCLFFIFKLSPVCRFCVLVIHSSTPHTHKTLALIWSLLLCAAGFFICYSCYFVHWKWQIQYDLCSRHYLSTCVYKLLLRQGIINLSWLIQTCWDGETPIPPHTLTQSVPNCRVKTGDIRAEIRTVSKLVPGKKITAERYVTPDISSKCYLWR